MLKVPELKRIREERGVSLQTITEEAEEVAYAELWNAEYRGGKVREETARIVARVLGVEVEHLIGEKPAPPPPPDCPSWLAVLDPLMEEAARC